MEKVIYTVERNGIRTSGLWVIEGMWTDRKEAEADKAYREQYYGKSGKYRISTLATYSPFG